MFTIESNELWKWQWELHIFKILAALEFNYLIIFQYNTKIDKILLLRILEKTIIYVVLLQNIIIRTHLVFYNLIITFYILTSRSGFFETESLFLKKNINILKTALNFSINIFVKWMCSFDKHHSIKSKMFNNIYLFYKMILL